MALGISHVYTPVGDIALLVWWRITELGPLLLDILSPSLLLGTKLLSGYLQLPIELVPVSLLLQHNVRGVRHLRTFLSSPILARSIAELVEYKEPAKRKPSPKKMGPKWLSNQQHTKCTNLEVQ